MAQEFEPYVQINPTQQVRDIYSPGPARALAQFPKAGDAGIGKAFSDLIPALLDYQGIQDKEAKKKQDAEAQAIVASKDANELAALLQKNIKDGKVPPGYSVYLLRQVNAHLGQKVFRKFAIEADKELDKFKDANNEVTAEGAVEAARQRVFEELGLDIKYGSAEFQKSFGNAYNEYAFDFQRRAGKLQSDAKIEQGTQAFRDDVYQAVSAGIEYLDEAGVEVTSAALTKRLRPIIKAYADAGLTNAQEEAFNAVMQFVETLRNSGNTDDIEEAEDLVEALRGVDFRGKGPGSKTQWGHTYKANLDTTDNQINASMRAASGFTDDQGRVNILMTEPWVSQLIDSPKETFTREELVTNVQENWPKDLPRELQADVINKIEIAINRQQTGRGAESVKSVGYRIGNAKTPKEVSEIGEAAIKLYPKRERDIQDFMNSQNARLQQVRSRIRKDPATFNKVAKGVAKDYPTILTPVDTEAPKKEREANGVFNRVTIQGLQALVKKLVSAQDERLVAEGVKTPDERNREAEALRLDILTDPSNYPEIKDFIDDREVAKKALDAKKDAARKEVARVKEDIKSEVSTVEDYSGWRSGVSDPQFHQSVGPSPALEVSRITRKLRDPLAAIVKAGSNGRYGGLFNSNTGVIEFSEKATASGWQALWEWDYDKAELKAHIEAYHTHRAKTGFIVERKWERVGERILDQDGIMIPDRYMNPATYPVIPSWVMDEASQPSSRDMTFKGAMVTLEELTAKYPIQGRELQRALIDNYLGVTAKTEGLDGITQKGLLAFITKRESWIRSDISTRAGKIINKLPETYRYNPHNTLMQQRRLYEDFTGKK